MQKASMQLVIWGSSSEEGKLGATETQGEGTSDREQCLIRAQNPKEKSARRPEKGSWEAAASGKVKRSFHRDRASGLLRGLQKRL